uniref:DX domain-containing protein n=1 Tax=Panagrellus redivivus TaxID=6233 RepID=A0A7E4VRH3_PANRE
MRPINYEISNNEAAEMAKDCEHCVSTNENDTRILACYVSAKYEFMKSEITSVAGCGEIKLDITPINEPTFKCQKIQKDATSKDYSVVCYCTASMCNDIFPFLEELKKFDDRLTTTKPMTRTPYNPYPETRSPPFMCYSSENDGFFPRECPSHKCMFSSQKTDKGQIVNEYHCMEVLNNMKGCQIIDGKELQCYCLESLCNTKSWAAPQINSFHSKRFTCNDYSDTKIETESKSIKCNGPPQCTSYMHKTEKHEIQFEGGCLDGSRLESLYTDDCYFDKEYPDGPLFVCYCSQSNCNNFDAFIEWAKEKKAYKWIEDAYKEVNSHRGHEYYVIFSLLLFQLIIMVY